MVPPTPTTALWPWQILGLALQLWPAQLSIHPAVVALETLILSGTFPMEVKSWTVPTYPTTRLEATHSLEKELFLHQCCSTATLRVPQRESSTVTYLMPVVYYRASMWAYTLAPLVSPVPWVSSWLLVRRYLALQTRTIYFKCLCIPHTLIGVCLNGLVIMCGIHESWFSIYWQQ